MNGFLVLNVMLLKYIFNNYFIIVLYKTHSRPSVIRERSNLEIQSLGYYSSVPNYPYLIF